MRRLDRELERAHGLDNTEYGVLVVLVNAPERSLRLGELATRNMAIPGGMSRIVDRLAALGLVERRPDPHDRGERTQHSPTPAYASSVSSRSPTTASHANSSSGG